MPTSISLSETKVKLQKICAESTDGSRVYDRGEAGYYKSIAHFVISSTEPAEFAVEPGSASTLAKVMKVLAEDKAHFAVKGGGHAMNPHFSSTKGVQISMARFNQVEYDDTTEGLAVGAGNIWDDVYDIAENYKRKVVGGSSNQGVGVAGWLLGGGYSMKTNKYGLGIDNVLKYRVVLPDGQICVATESNSYRDLYQALRGGGNNFGIVTEFTLKTYPQFSVKAAALLFSGTQEEAVKSAIVKYVGHETPPEAAVVSAFRHTLVNGIPDYNISTYCVYDFAEPDDFQGKLILCFRPFFNIMRIYNTRNAGAALSLGTSSSEARGTVDQSDEPYFRQLSSVEANRLASFPYDFATDLPLRTVSRQDAQGVSHSVRYVVGPPPDSSRGARRGRGGHSQVVGMTEVPVGLGELDARGRFACIMVSKYTKNLVDAIAAEARKAAQFLSDRRGKLVLIDVWPFLPSIFDNSPGGAAWPHKKGEPLGPLLAYFLWEKEEDDTFWVDKMKAALDNILKVALAEGCTTETAPYYSNTSLGGTPVADIYRDHLKELSKARAKYDPNDVMGQTGGFKIPLA
ncbi:uncharacterized protein B0H18DRAFT_1119801 [Fomitopsis serialis]|uniref:uncharacterized protein n=1 Tax=Fomitopsis serialis TaxID=139415 RepID=UPI0020086A4D|nr:uncharacterized protein B0H18DRAFT_1119801 [Neoantrodia serialis]KAH9924785.1 hypothetical protein B0H18DRAFT_1119801 [Neoantrodia serialis]